MQGDAQSIRDGLRDVIDFEIGLDVVALGMIREIDITEENVRITMILTSPMCPMASFMMNQVRDRAAEMVETPVEVVMGKEMPLQKRLESPTEGARDTTQTHNPPSRRTETEVALQSAHLLAKKRDRRRNAP